MAILDDIWGAVSGRSDYRADAPKGVRKDIGQRMDRRRSAFEGYGNPQQEIANAVTDRALGRGGPSVAELQMKRGLGTAQQGAASRAAAGRGLGRGAAQRMSMSSQAGLASQANEQAGMLRAQEQIGAQQLAGNQWRDLRQQELLALGYDLEEAKALIDAEMKAQGLITGTSEANAKNAQGPSTMLAAAAGGALAASDVRAKEVESYGLPDYGVSGSKGMPSDFTGKEIQPGQFGAAPYEPPIPQYRGGPMMGDTPYLKVEEGPKFDAGLEKQAERLNAFDIGQQAAGGDTAQSAKTGFDIGRAIGGMLSDEKAKELVEENSILRDIAGVVAGGVAGGAAGAVTRPKGPAAPRYGTPPPPPSSPGYGPMLSDFSAKELDDMARSATAFGGPSETMQASDRLAPVQPVGYRYKPEDSARMANDEVKRIESLYGNIPEDDEEDVAAQTYADKRAPRRGIIAQDLERSPSMRSSVVKQDNRLAVDRDRALSTALGEMAGLAQEVRQLKRAVYPTPRQPNF